MNGYEPLISVIIPTYNYGRLIPKAIGSVLLQSYTNYEIIVIDDGSEDDTNEVISGIVDNYPDSIIKYTRTENRGIGAAKTLGIEQASGDYLLFMDADDYMDSKCIESLVSKTKFGDTDWVIGSFRFVDENGRIIKEEKAFERDSVTKWCYTYIHANLFRRELFTKYGIKLETSFATDVETTFQFCAHSNNIEYCDNTQYNYLIHNSTTRDPKRLYEFVMAGDPRCNLSDLFGSMSRNVQHYLSEQDYAGYEYGLIRFYYSKLLVTVQGYSKKEVKDIYSVYNNAIIDYFPDYIKNEYLFKVFSGMTRVRKLVTPACAFMEKTGMFKGFLCIYAKFTGMKRIVD